jgi:toxin ParE1/3/4
VKRRFVQWSRDALDDLKSQIAYIAGDNPAAARRVVARIKATGAALGEIATGKPSRVSGCKACPAPALHNRVRDHE